MAVRGRQRHYPATNGSGTDEWIDALVVRGQTFPRTGVCLRTGAQPRRRSVARKTGERKGIPEC